MIKGIDISHWNIPSRIDYDEPEFIIMKASEGSHYADPLMINHAGNAVKRGKAIGFYHYARPELNNPKDEAENFLRQLHGFIGRSILALDWEGKALTHPIEWAREWCDYITDKTGTRPLFYCQYSYTDKINLIREGNYGLWIARYNKDLTVKTMKAKDGKPWAIWQHTSVPLDRDIFNGSLKQFIKYY